MPFENMLLYGRLSFVCTCPFLHETFGSLYLKMNQHIARDIHNFKAGADMGFDVVGVSGGVTYRRRTKHASGRMFGMDHNVTSG